MHNKFLIAFLLTVFILKANSQEKESPKIKFGKITAEDLNKSSYEIDTAAEAVVLYDYCNVQYEGDQKADFNVQYSYHMRIKILSKNAFDLATVYIPLSKYSQMEEKVKKLEALTYNLENGKIVENKLDKSAIFKDKVEKNFEVHKFTLPNVKEGSIIEYVYTVISPYSRSLKKWSFQGRNPTLWSELNISVPSIYDFLTIKYGTHPYCINKTTVGQAHYNITIPSDHAAISNDHMNLRLNTYEANWAMENLPAIKEENYTTNIRNHIAAIEFQLSSIRYPDKTPIPVIKPWSTACEQLLKHEDFGAELYQKNNWLKDELAKMSLPEDPVEKAKKIFVYVRDNFICNDNSSLFLSSSSLKKIYQAKAGNVADINLLLTAMLVNANIEARPAILSTKENGKAFETQAILSKFNYVIAQAIINDSNYLLDASVKKIGFNKLPQKCYNGSARSVDIGNPYLIPLSSENIKENKLTTVNIIADSATHILSGQFTSQLGYYESLDARSEVGDGTTEKFFEKIKKTYTADIDIAHKEIERLKEYDETATVSYEFRFPPADDGIIYLNPLFTEAYKTNPFKSAQRHYPVEMPYPVNEVFLFTLQIPEGYTIEEIPKSVRVKLNESDEGMFEYIIQKTEQFIQMRSTIRLKKATFMPEEYDMLRAFFAQVVKKHAEQIVIKPAK